MSPRRFWQRAVLRCLHISLRVLVLLAAYLFGTAAWHAGDGLSDLDAIQHAGVLRVASKPGATTFLEGPDGRMGFEFNLMQGFADQLGVQLQIVAVEDFSEFQHLLNRGEADVAASGISRTAERERSTQIGAAYQDIHELVVYRAGSPRPRSTADLEHARIGVLAGTSYEETLRQLRQSMPQLSWTRYYQAGIEELLQDISDGEIDLTLIDDHLFNVHRRFYPAVRHGFTLPDSENQLVWLFPKHGRELLHKESLRFFDRIEQSGELADLRQRYYSHVEEFDFIGSFSFLRHVDGRLPMYRSLFERAAREYDFDWRLLAAVGYQESHWNPDAVSRTGVRGIMMLTLNAADDLGVANRRDPAQSIDGGARYLRSLYQRLPDRIPDDDRLWLALAAYNVGLGHLEDARVITERQGGDPDRWLDVKQHLPLLAQKKWYSQTRWGYARGWEPVQYVENIRSYYDILIWLTRDQAGSGTLTANRAPLPAYHRQSTQQATGRDQ